MDLIERLEDIGLSTEAITHIASLYDLELDPRADLWGYIEAWVLSRRSDEYVAEYGYQQELIRCGLSDGLAAKHMDAEFAIFRRMQDPWSWALDTLRMRYDMLNSIEEAPSDGGNEDNNSGEGRSLGACSEEKPSSSKSAGHPEGAMNNLRQPASGEAIWLKGSIRSRLLDGYSATTLRMNPRSIPSLPPTDFGGLLSCLYLTDSIDVAKQYARWATRRAAPGPGSEAMILYLYIPSNGYGVSKSRISSVI